MILDCHGCEAAEQNRHKVFHDVHFHTACPAPVDSGAPALSKDLVLAQRDGAGRESATTYQF